MLVWRVMMLRAAVVLAASFLFGCAMGSAGASIDAGRDARVPVSDAGGPDAGALDSGAASMDAGVEPADAAAMDGGPPLDAGILEAGVVDAGFSDSGAPLDGGPSDAGASDAGGCGAVGIGHTLSFDGVDDLGKYPPSQLLLPPGEPLASWGGFGMTWDRTYLYVTMVTPAFASADRPLHVYAQSASSLSPAAPTTGKRYAGLTPELPFSPTHLIAARRVSTLGGLPPYNGVYMPADGWETRVAALEVGSEVWVAADNHTISVRIPWTSLGCPRMLRVTVHVVNGAVGNEWKDLVPVGATPWLSPGGRYYEIDLSGTPEISGWSLR